MSEPRAAALLAAGQAIPNPVPIRALVDTGASGTCVERSILDSLGLTPSGSIECHTPSTGATPLKKDQFDVSIVIYASANQPQLQFSTLPVMESELFAAQGIHVLIGRDILEHCLLTYNGTMKLFTLAF